MQHASWILIFGCFLWLFVSGASAQDTSTPEERTQWVEVTHKLESAPLDDSVNQQGEAAFKRLSDVHDVLDYGNYTYTGSYDGLCQHALSAHKFTGKERDSESGLDDFEARHYASTMGRFMQPDPAGGHNEDPQTLDRYAYVRNNPLSLTGKMQLGIYNRCTLMRTQRQDSRQTQW
jgi:RHS repeat-associated protein